MVSDKEGGGEEKNVKKCASYNMFFVPIKRKLRRFVTAVRQYRFKTRNLSFFFFFHTNRAVRKRLAMIFRTNLHQTVRLPFFCQGSCTESEQYFYYSVTGNSTYAFGKSFTHVISSTNTRWVYYVYTATVHVIRAYYNCRRVVHASREP